MTLSDHQDSESFMGVRSEDEVLRMLDLAERGQNHHFTALQSVFTESDFDKKLRNYHMRNYKALQGVVKSLRWVLGDKDVEHPLE